MNSGAGTATDTSDRLKAAIAELGGIQSLLVAGELDPRILTDFRDAVNRVRNTAWAAYQYTESKITGKDSRSIISIVAGERRVVTELKRWKGSTPIEANQPN